MKFEFLDDEAIISISPHAKERYTQREQVLAYADNRVDLHWLVRNRLEDSEVQEIILDEVQSQTRFGIELSKSFVAVIYMDAAYKTEEDERPAWYFRVETVHNISYGKKFYMRGENEKYIDVNNNVA